MQYTEIFVFTCKIIENFSGKEFDIFFIFMLKTYVVGIYEYNMSLCMRKPTIWVPTRSDTNRAVQAQKMVRDLKFWI